MECCGECVYNIADSKDEWICRNEESEAYGLGTFYDDVCEEFEGRD